MKHTWGDSTELGDSEVDINIGSGEIDLREGEIYVPYKEEEADLDLNINIVDMVEKTMKLRKEGDNVREGAKRSYLWAVVVVDRHGQIWMDEKIVADTEDEAKFNLGVYDKIKSEGMEFSKTNIIVRKLDEVVVEDEDAE